MKVCYVLDAQKQDGFYANFIYASLNDYVEEYVHTELKTEKSL